MLKYFKLSIWVRTVAGARRSPQVQWCEEAEERDFLQRWGRRQTNRESTGTAEECPEIHNFQAVTPPQDWREGLGYSHWVKESVERADWWAIWPLDQREHGAVHDNPWLHSSPFSVSSWCSWPDSPVSQEQRCLHVGCTGQPPRCRGPDVCPHSNPYVKPNSQCDGILEMGS